MRTKYSLHFVGGLSWTFISLLDELGLDEHNRNNKSKLKKIDGCAGSPDSAIQYSQQSWWHLK